MKTKEGFMLREVGGTSVVVAVGTANDDFNGIITLNEPGSLLWKALEKGADLDALVKVITDEYEVDNDTAKADVTEFIKIAQEAELLDD